MREVLHSVRLIDENCNGCTRCMIKCPTEAVRLKNSRAVIYNDRCIDCGECIRVCPYNARVANKGHIDDIFKYKLKVAIPSVTLYSQFGDGVNPNIINEGLLSMGFDEVFDVSYACDIVSEIIKIEMERVEKPVISPFCPSVLRLIQNSYPHLLDHVPRAMTPIEVAAKLIRDKHRTAGYSNEDVGVFYLSPCVSWITDIRNPKSITGDINDAIPIGDIYSTLLKYVNKNKGKNYEEDDCRISKTGMAWSLYGGQSNSMGFDEFIAVGGVESVVKVFDDIEKGKMQDVQFVEAFTCNIGCLGGIFLVENPYNAERISRKLISKLKYTNKSMEISEDVTNRFTNRNIMQSAFSEKLAEDFKEAVKRMKLMNRLINILPGKECGLCGSPSCRAFAEDVARGLSRLEECKMIGEEGVFDESKRNY